MKRFSTIAAIMLILSVSGCQTDSPVAPELTDITVSVPPSKRVYNQGEKFDPKGLEVMGTYSDGTEKPVTGYTLSAVDTSAAGTKTVTVTLRGLSAEFTVRVRQEGSALVSIEVTALPDKTHYAVGEAFDPKGLEVTGTWSDGTEEPVTGYTLGAVDTAAAGTKTVTVTLRGLSAEFTVRVRQEGSTLVSIEVTALPDKTHYAVGEAFDPAGLEVTGTYSDGTEEPVTEYTLSAVDMSTEGAKTVTVTLNGLEATFTVTVGEAVPASIAVTSPPEKIVYRTGEAFNPSGLTVAKVWSDGTKEAVTDYTLGAVDTAAAGAKTVEVSWGEFKTQFSVFVSGGSLVSIAVSREPDRGQSWGAAIDLTGIEVTGTFSDFPDTPIPITVGPANVSGYDPALLPGTQAVTITVEGKTASFTALVSALFFDYGKPRTRGQTVSGSYSVPIGRTLVLAPVRWGIGAGAVYEWKVDGVVQPGAVTECFAFTPKTRKTYTVSVSARDGRAYAETSTQVRCVERQGTYKRPKTTGSKAYTPDLFGFYAAPGYAGGYTFVDWLEKGKAKDWVFGLGGFGGSVVLGFDHSVENKPGQYSLAIFGNSFEGWGEPGVVWVMQDENGNGQPDDTWYELAGSENGLPNETKRYAAAYTAGKVYIDNRGGSEGWQYPGASNGFFTWPTEPGSYVIFSGTNLEENSYNTGGILYHPGPAWGYVDSDQYFRISDAIQADGSPANLDYIDFVRVQSAVLFNTGVVSEVTTECGLGFDYSMDH